MEFKYRALDNKTTPPSTPTPPPPPPTTTTTSYPHPPPVSTITYLSERSLQSGFSSVVVNSIPNTFPMPVNSAHVGEALRRELEKEQIRREIIAGEIARRVELEEEVRREMALERGWGIAMQRNLVAASQGFSLEDRVAMRLNHRLNTFENIVAAPQPQLPQLMAPPEIKPSPETDKDKVIILAKPDPNLYGAKRKALTPPAVDGGEPSPFGLKKKPKEEWSCALCQLSTTSERALNEHLQGKKHKSKEAALRIQKIGKSTNTPLLSEKSEKSVKSTEAIIAKTLGLDEQADSQPLQLGKSWGDINQTMVDKGGVKSQNEEQIVQKTQDVEGLKNDVGIVTGQDAGKINAPKGSKIKFWCEICQVGTASRIVMESHKNGRKHLARMKKFGENYGSAPPASSVSSEAPVMINDTDAVNKEPDQEITRVLNKETTIKHAESSTDIDQVSPVAESSGDGAGEGL